MAITLSGTAALTFIDGVNRVLRINNVIAGGDDDITTFSDSQHVSDISRAKIAIQDEIADLIADDYLLPWEKTSGTIALVSGQRSYSLSSDFITFFGKRPSFYDSTDNRRLYEYPGGEDSLRDSDYQYQTNTGTPIDWYWDRTTTKKVAFYNVPNATYNGRSLSYDYEGSVMVQNSTDALPFHNVEEGYSFCAMVARRFRFMLLEQDAGLLTQDATYNNAKCRLVALMKGKHATNGYGRSYV